MSSPSAKIGHWYLDRDQHDFLCVTGVHEDDGVVAIRDEYGDVDEIEFDEWESMDLVLCATSREPEYGDELDEDNADGLDAHAGFSAD